MLTIRSLSLGVILVFGQSFLLAKEKQPATYSIPLPPKPDFTALDWIVGEWAGTTAGKERQVDVRFSASYDLDQRFMILREEVSFAATKTAPASKETSMGILSASKDSGFVLRWFSATGFITRYHVAVDGTEIFLNQEGGDNPPPGWLFRRLIRHPDPSQFVETVQVAPANRPFFDYYTVTLTRVLPAKAGAANPH